MKCVSAIEVNWVRHLVPLLEENKVDVKKLSQVRSEVKKEEKSLKRPRDNPESIEQVEKEVRIVEKEIPLTKEEKLALLKERFDKRKKL